MDLNSSGPEVITNAQRCVARLWLRALVTLLEHLSLGPYKESVASVQIQMQLDAPSALRVAHMLLVILIVLKFILES